jgi:glycosyltransferase involved in cell wall biosynthesis
VVRAVLDWCTLLPRRGHQVTLLTYDTTDIPSEWLPYRPGVPQVVALPRTNRLGRLNAPALEIALSVIENADVLHLHGMWLTSNLQLANIARETATPFVLTTHGMLDDWATSQGFVKKRIFHALFGRRFIRQAARAHCTAAEEQRQAEPWLEPTPVSVLPYLVDLEPFQNLKTRDTLAAPSSVASSPANAIPTLLFLSRLHAKKGPELLIDTMAELRKRGQPARLLIAGEGETTYEAALRDRTRQFALGDIVKFLGLITGDAKLALFQSADLFVLPTSQENFGIALIEAAACGTPLLTTKGVDIWRELEPAGARIAERSVNGFADAIEELLRDRAALAKRGQASREWVFNTLDPDKLAAEYEALYQSVADRLP